MQSTNIQKTLNSSDIKRLRVVVCKGQVTAGPFVRSTLLFLTMPQSGVIRLRYGNRPQVDGCCILFIPVWRYRKWNSSNHSSSLLLLSFLSRRLQWYPQWVAPIVTTKKWKILQR